MAEPRTPDDNMTAQQRDALATDPNPDAPEVDRGDGLPEGVEPPSGQAPSPQDIDPDLDGDRARDEAPHTP